MNTPSNEKLIEQEKEMERRLLWFNGMWHRNVRSEFVAALGESKIDAVYQVALKLFNETYEEAFLEGKCDMALSPEYEKQVAAMDALCDEGERICAAREAANN